MWSPLNALDDSWTEAPHAAGTGLAAEAFGAKRTYFATNGTSGAIHAMLQPSGAWGTRRLFCPGNPTCRSSAV